MHILIGLILALAVITVLLIGCFYGNLFACVFLSILPGGFLLLCCVERGLGGLPDPLWALASIALLAGIWAPRYQRRHQAPGHRHPAVGQKAGVG
jgi:hypothetical protein